MEAGFGNPGNVYRDATEITGVALKGLNFNAKPQTLNRRGMVVTHSNDSRKQRC